MFTSFSSGSDAHKVRTTVQRQYTNLNVYQNVSMVTRDGCQSIEVLDPNKLRHTNNMGG